MIPAHANVGRSLLQYTRGGCAVRDHLTDTPYDIDYGEVHVGIIS